MHKQLPKLSLVLILFLSLLVGLTDKIKAKSAPIFLVTSTEQKTTALAADPNVVTWEMLELEENNLTGPDDSTYFTFILPADWKLIEGASLNLSLGVTVSSGIQDQANSENNDQTQPYAGGIIGAGTLTLLVNNSTISILPLDQVGEIVRTIPIPVAALTSSTTEGLVEVGLALNSGTSCYNFDQMNVVIRTSSFFTLPHEAVLPSTSLVKFPRPIYQNSFIPDSVLIVVPDQPSAAELQASITVAAGLGKLSYSTLVFDMVTLSKLTPEQEAANHLIFVGKPSSLPILGQFELPLPLEGGNFQVSGGNVDDGFVQMANSPWSNANVVLVVTGNTDQGIIKAAQAVSTGVFQPNKLPNLAVVQEVQTIPVLKPQPTDQTLSALGYKARLLESRGVSSASYNFDIPPGWTVSPDASFEFVFGHSALLNYSTSGIVVLLNGNPIGSVRMNDDSASLSTNKALINIPTSAVVPGRNRLDVRVTLEPRDLCSPPNMRGLWVNIWPESTLHLPLDLAEIDPISSLSLASYPAPFTYYPLLDNLAFVLMHDDPESWRSAITIAGLLGYVANGPVIALNVYYDDNLPEAERSKHNFLIIGRPSQMPIMGEINKDLPIPFLEGTDILTDGNFQVAYRILPDAPMGYMQIMPSPWNPENTILAVLGNTTQGINWATSFLIDPKLRYRLAGNLAVINDKQIITTDTRLSPTIRPEPTQVAEVAVVPENPDATISPSAQQSTWVVPVFVASLILIILISAFVSIGSWLRHRTRGNVHGDDYRSGGRALPRSAGNWFSAIFQKMKNRGKGK